MNKDDKKCDQDIIHKHAILTKALNAKFKRYNARTNQTFIDFVIEKIKELPD